MKRRIKWVSLMAFIIFGTDGKGEENGQSIPTTPVSTLSTSDSQIELRIPMEDRATTMTDADKIIFLENKLKRTQEDLSHYSGAKAGYALGGLGVVGSIVCGYIKYLGFSMADEVCHALQGRGGSCYPSACDPNLLASPTVINSFPGYRTVGPIIHRNFPLKQDCDTEQIVNITYYVCVGVMAVAIIGLIWNCCTVPSLKGHRA